MLAASDHLLTLLSQPCPSITHSIVCPVLGNRLKFHLCATSSSNILHAFNHMLQRVEFTVSILSAMADTLDDGLLQMEIQLRSIHDLLSDEAGVVIAAWDDILSDPLSRLGWNNRGLRHYNTCLQAIRVVKSFHNTASAYVGAVKGRLWSVSREMEVLKVLSEESGISNALPMVAMVHALCAGIVRVRESQVALAGKELGDHAVQVQLAGGTSIN